MEKMKESSLKNFGSKLKQWKPGQSGNPKGRPPKLISITSQLKEHLCEIDEATEKTKAEIIVEKLIDLALAGNLEAIKEIMNRVDGKVVERHEIENKTPVTLVFMPAQTTQVEYMPEANSQVEDQEKPLLVAS
jgi:hypothetical protein